MDIVLRGTFLFFALYLTVRLLGKRELAQMTPFELILLVVMGDLVQQGITHSDYSLTGAVLAVATFAFWALVMSWLSYLSPRAEAILDGKPRVLIRDGRILTENLHRDRLTRAEIEAEMRQAGIGRIQDVAWAILESRGRISFLRHSSEEPPRRFELPSP